MSALKFVANNFRWLFNKEHYTKLLTQSISQQSLWILLERNAPIWQKYCNAKPINLDYTEFCLNEIALSNANNKITQRLKSLYGRYCKRFFDLRTIFNIKRIQFVAGKMPRIEEAVELFVSSTQLNYTQECWQQYKEALNKYIVLDNAELDNLDNVLALWQIRYYCAVYHLARQNAEQAERYMCNFVDCGELLMSRYSQNDYYSKTVFVNDQMVSMVDCLANSAVIVGNTQSSFALGMRVLCNGKNVFDTFCQHKYGKNTANFLSSNNSVTVGMQYYLVDRCEVRHCTIQGNVSSKRNYTLQLDCYSGKQNANSQRCNIGEMQVIACGVDNGYVGVCLVQNSKILPVQLIDNSNNSQVRLRISTTFSLKRAQSATFDVVTVYADSIEQLNESYRMLQSYGYTHCPYAEDISVEGKLYTRKTAVVSGNNLYERYERDKDSSVFSYSTRLGDNVSTLLDKSGKGTTLINGFAFGIGGEKIFVIEGGKVNLINNAPPVFKGYDIERVQNIDDRQVTLIEQHDEHKTYNIISTKPQRVLFMFNFEQPSTVTRNAQGEFLVSNKLRQFVIAPKGIVESFTTNSIECNQRRFRYKLSNDLTQGNCLCICFAPTCQTSLVIRNARPLPQAQPLIKESLLSTYLNYTNSKTMYGIVNGLEKADALKISALTYTVPQFVKQLIEHPNDGGGITYYHYDGNGYLHIAEDRLAYALASIYYALITGDRSQLTDKNVRLIKQILSTQYTGKSKCIQALALRRLVQLNIDKVDALIKYGNLKKQIVTDKSLYAYAQAIGAVDMINPSKQRLKDLCSTYGVNKSWYYVSQLENLYGVKVNGNNLTVTPVVNADNVLENLVLYVSKRRIETSFEKSNIQQLVVNGNPCYSTIDTAFLKDTNTITVRY